MIQKSEVSVDNKIPETVPLKREVLILGGGIAGLRAAKILAAGNVRVTIVEKESSPGGSAGQLHFFAGRSGNAAKWLREMIDDIKSNNNIDILTDAELCALRGHLGSFQAKIRKKGGDIAELSPSALVMAVGYEKQAKTAGIDEASREVIYLPELETLIAQGAGGKLTRQGQPINSVTFILDRVNDDIKIDSVNVLKQALILRKDFNCRVFVLCRDLKVSFAGGERLYRKAREEGVLFFKYDQVPEVVRRDDHIFVELVDLTDPGSAGGEKIVLSPDILAVPEICLPNLETEKLCRLLRIRLEQRSGYLLDDNPQHLRIRSNRRGIFVAGACRHPQILTETLKEAEAVAQEIMALLAPGEYTCGPLVAEVDPKKCSLCYTCPRLCPHSAITVEKYAPQNVYGLSDGATLWKAALVSPAACYGCGICIAECPARAITLRGEETTFNS